MIKIFGKKLCSACQEKKAELDAQGVTYQFFDLDTADGLVEAAFDGVLGRNLPLPIILEVDSQENEETFIGQDNQDNQDSQDSQDNQDSREAQDTQDKKPEDPEKSEDRDNPESS